MRYLILILMVSSVNATGSTVIKGSITRAPVTLDTLNARIEGLERLIRSMNDRDLDTRSKILKVNQCHDECDIRAPWPGYDESPKSISERENEEMIQRAKDCRAKCGEEPQDVIRPGC